MTATLPILQVLPGNHEAECHSPICYSNSNKRSAFQNFTAYNRRFRMPSPESGGTLNMWYSFDYGSIHFVQIDTETDFPGASNDEFSSKNGSKHAKPRSHTAWLTQLICDILQILVISWDGFKVTFLLLRRGELLGRCRGSSCQATGQFTRAF
jgi:hypothetical protein